MDLNFKWFERIVFSVDGESTLSVRYGLETIRRDLEIVLLYKINGCIKITSLRERTDSIQNCSPFSAPMVALSNVPLLACRRVSNLV